jgi:hypothetical protein
MPTPRRLLAAAVLAAAVLVPAATAAADPPPPTQVPQRTYHEGDAEGLPVPLRCPTLADHCDWRFFAYDETATSGLDFDWPEAGKRVTMTGGQHGGTYLPMAIRRDDIYEGTETFLIRAVLVVTGTSGIRIQRIDDARMTILDAQDPPLPLVRPLPGTVVCGAACTPIQVLPQLPGPAVVQ